MPYIELSGKRGKGLRTLVDQDTFERYGHLAWHLSDTGYAVRRTREGMIRLHRLVAGTPEGMFTDHKNHDRLDNRGDNLRIVTQAENMANSRSKGYTWDASKGKWMVRYRSRFYGRYETEADAIQAVKDARSGKPRPSRLHPRRRYLPKGVLYMKSLPPGTDKRFYIRPQRNGKKYFKGYFSTPQEAETAYNNFLREEDSLSQGQ